MNWPPEKGKGALQAPIPKPIKLLQAYLRSLSVQPKGRRCLVCGVRISNANLGGHSRSSALAGPLFCFLYADGLERRRT